MKRNTKIIFSLFSIVERRSRVAADKTTGDSRFFFCCYFFLCLFSLCAFNRIITKLYFTNRGLFLIIIFGVKGKAINETFTHVWIVFDESKSEEKVKKKSASDDGDDAADVTRQDKTQNKLHKCFAPICLSKSWEEKFNFVFICSRVKTVPIDIQEKTTANSECDVREQ